ncbi:MAG: hypothetical protein ABIY52_00570, partial [Gemmatimonadaceae bacterium]
MRKLALILAAVPALAAAQSARTLTLQDAIRMAQEQGPAAQIARSTRDAAHFRDNAFNSRLMPQLFLRGTAANLNHGISPVTLDDGTTQYLGQSQNTSAFSLGFDQAVPLTGGTLTATPIPRTLNMAMAGLRDLSIIATPPAHRMAV